MNILIFVMSLLMLLAVITYGRLDMYRSFIVTQSEFERYMSEGERNAINSGAQQWYDWTVLSQKNGGPKKYAPREASPKLSVAWLFRQEKGTESQNDPIYRELLKKLMYTVFGEQNDFKSALEKNPNLVDDLINAIQAAAIRLNVEKKLPKTTNGLENLELENPTLQDVYYRMIKGYRRTKPIQETPSLNERYEDFGEREEPSDNQIEEYVHKKNTISLLDFITINSKKTKIRVFLAPKAILSIIFGDSHTVDEIMQNRLEMYLQARNENDHDNLTEQFKQKFVSRAQNVPETMLDFSVTTTDPRNYEIQ